MLYLTRCPGRRTDFYEVRGDGLWEYDRGNVDNEGTDTQTASADCMDGTRGLDFSRLKSRDG